MKVLLVTQYFYPENFKSNDIAFELVKRGYEVTVLTGIPNYPQGCFFQGYGLFSKKMEKVQGVEIRRAWLFPRGRGGGGRLALNYFSWAFFASFYAFFLSLFHKYDVVLVHEPSPITQGIPAIIIKKMQRIPVYFWVLDLWPESLISAGGVTNKYVISFFTKIVKWIYNSSDKILISSKGFRQSILEKGNFESKLVYFPNWAEDIFSSFCEYSLPQLPDGFIVMFAGNMGEAQDLENVMKGALKLKENKDVKFVFVGDGRKKAWVDDFIQKNSLADTVFTLGRYPLEMMPSFFSKADVMLLSLKSETIFNLTVPAKLQTYMASGKPILAMINGEGENIVREVNCGLTAKAGDSGQLAEAIMELKRMPFEKRMQLGKNGQEYYRRNFTLEKCMDNLCHIIQDNQQ